MKIAPDILAVLSAAQTEGNQLVLTGQLDRKLYEGVNKVLVALGGKWNRGAKAHVFTGDAGDALEQIVLTGEYRDTKRDLGQFYTPPDLAIEVVRRAGITPGMQVLEPSAGQGAIAKAADAAGGHVVCVDIDWANVDCLRVQGFDATCSDFLRFQSGFPEKFGAVVMNPPFAGQADIHHVTHALRHLAPGGRLVSIMSAGVMFRENALTRDFRALVHAHKGRIDELPEDSFKASGTGVRTVIVEMVA